MRFANASSCCLLRKRNVGSGLMLNGFCLKPKKALYMGLRFRCGRWGMRRFFTLRRVRFAAGRWLSLSGGLLRLRSCLHRAYQNMRVAALKTRDAFDGAVSREIAGEADEQFFAEIGVSDFAPAELNHRLNPVALLKKANGVILLEVVVVVVRVGAEFQFLHLHDVLLLFRV